MNINKNIQMNAPLTGEQIIKNLIETDLKSPEKILMSLTADYYAVKNTKILAKQITYFEGNPPVKRIDTDAVNNKIPSAFNKELIDQAVNFSISQDITLSTADETEQEMLDKIKTDVIKRKFKKFLKSAYKKARKDALTWCYYFVNDKGEFDYMLMDALNIIPIYDQSFENILLQIIRYYPITSVDNQGNEVQIFKVEVYDDKSKTVYIQNPETKDYALATGLTDPTLQMNPTSYINQRFTINGATTEEPLSWGRVPFIKLRCNDEEIPDLQLNKQYIDAYDRLVSETQDELDALADKFIAIKGYNAGVETGANLMRNLKMLKFVPVAEGGGVDIISEAFDAEGKIKILDEYRRNVYRFGMGVDMNSEMNGAISGVALDRQFYNLKMKASDGEDEVADFIRKFYDAANYFISNVASLSDTLVNKYKGLKPIDAENINVKFNRAIITDNEGVIKVIKESKGVVSTEGLLEMHPYVENVAKELERIEAEKKKELDQFDVLPGDNV